MIRRCRRLLLWTLLAAVSLAGCATEHRAAAPPSVAAVAPASGAAAGWTGRVGGRVFLDSNANGRFDAGETGLADVPVTDGLAFVRTGPDGRYAIDAGRDAMLPAHASAIVSVCFPSRTWPVRDWFRRLGDARDPQQVDFALRPDAQDGPLVFVHGTDPHVPRGGKDKFITFRSEMAREAGRVKFCILTGDLTDLSNSHPFAQADAEWTFFAEQTRGFPVPLFSVAGNHDAAGVDAKPDAGWDPAHPRFGYGAYWQIVGPLRWSFDCAGVHFVGIDYPHVDKDGKWQWGSPPAAIEWLRRDLEQVKAGTRIFLFVHSPQGKAPKAGEPPAVRLPLDLLARHKVGHIFAGHSHTESVGAYGGAALVLSGSLSQVFEDKDRSVGYRLVRVSEGGVETFFKATGQPHAITIDAPRWRDALKPGDAVRGAFYDPQAVIRTLTVRVDGAPTDVPFVRGPLACRFETRPDLGSLGPGPHTVEVTVSDGRRSWTVQGVYPSPKK